jgi:hypothetical protein
MAKNLNWSDRFTTGNHLRLYRRFMSCILAEGLQETPSEAAFP